jgi:hypothetical protein
MPKPFKTLSEVAPRDAEKLARVAERLTAGDARAFAEADPADFHDSTDVGSVFADRELDGMIVYPEHVRYVDEYGMATTTCAYLAFSHAAFSGAAVWDNATGRPHFRLIELYVRDEPAFRAWLARREAEPGPPTA